MSTPWLTRKARLHALLKTTSDEDVAGLALDRILPGQNVIDKTTKTPEIDTLRFQDADLHLVGALERGQFGLMDVVKCHLDNQMYILKSLEKRFGCELAMCATVLLPPPHADDTHPRYAIRRGRPLWDVLESSPLNSLVAEEDMAWWIPQVVRCHSQGFAHRDIKPHNFVLTLDAHVLLIDCARYGVAEAREEDSALRFSDTASETTRLGYADADRPPPYGPVARSRPTHGMVLARSLRRVRKDIPIPRTEYSDQHLVLVLENLEISLFGLNPVHIFVRNITDVDVRTSETAQTTTGVGAFTHIRLQAVQLALEEVSFYYHDKTAPLPPSTYPGIFSQDTTPRLRRRHQHPADLVRG
ncbi:hypothetical protein DFH09DRAFT_1346754 [Mycena vulgaris]|nr:hypothetical protein DFH09DRAFT_1346754 [Mycena vulgaris]